MNAIITNFFTDFHYPFFTQTEKPHYREYMQTWIDSVRKLKLTAFILYDEDNPEMIAEFEDNLIKFVKVKPNDGLNPIDSRWNEFSKFLIKNRQIENVFFTDIRDVTVLRDPFSYMNTNFLYIGDELQNGNRITVGNQWIAFRVLHLINQTELINQFNIIKNLPVVNCGLFGGNRELVLEVLRHVTKLLKIYHIPFDTVDMVAFNVIMHLHFPGRFLTGHPINTEFWKWDFDNSTAWFQHK
jgi:hypothetical protein